LLPAYAIPTGNSITTNFSWMAFTK
jgi:hypothetical protein